MSIRRKLTVLLLFIALIPLVVSRFIVAGISWRASEDVAREMRHVLVDDAETSLLTVTQDFSRLLDAKEKGIELTVRLQAQKVEKRLADALLAKEGYKVINRPIKATSSSENALPFTPDKAVETLSAEERADPELLATGGLGSLDAPRFQKLRLPVQKIPFPGSSDMFMIKNFGWDEQIDASKIQVPRRYERIDPRTGKPVTSDISYRNQECYVVGEGGPDRRFELNALGSMTASYWLIRQLADQDLLWQYTILESGVITSYPDLLKPEPLFQSALAANRSMNEEAIKTLEGLRKSDFYLRVQNEGKIVFFPPKIDRTTGLAVMMVAAPLFYPDGSFAGITGFDLITKRLFSNLRLPADWEKDATAMLIQRLGPHSQRPGEIVILAKQLPSGSRPKEIKIDPGKEADAAGRVSRLHSLQAVDQKKLNELVDRAEAGGSGIVRMEFNGKNSLWAFGPAHEGMKAEEPFLLVIVPEEKVMAQAEENENRIIQSASKERWLTGLIFLAVALIASIIGFRSAKSVTRPIGQIAEAGIRLSEGDYHAHVDIRTGDELERLGQIFNETGPKLLEREKMMHSLAMAMEVQQQLLPQAPPVCEGLDIAGESRYCDETGGDYFDYLMLRREDGNTPRLGVAIGDVSGHGIGSALIMASVRSVLRSHAGALQDRLDRLMGLLNQSLMDESETGRFVTLCFSLFDPQERTLRWVSAGHDPAFHLHLDPATGRRTIDELPNSGVPLGVMDEADYEAMGPVQLSPGDVVLFGTDGAWETSDPTGHPFGKDRLRQILLENHDQPAEVIRRELFHAIVTFRATAPQLDDITLVVIKVV